MYTITNEFITIKLYIGILKLIVHNFYKENI